EARRHGEVVLPQQPHEGREGAALPDARGPFVLDRFLTHDAILGLARKTCRERPPCRSGVYLGRMAAPPWPCLHGTPRRASPTTGLRSLRPTAERPNDTRRVSRGRSRRG